MKRIIMLILVVLLLISCATRMHPKIYYTRMTNLYPYAPILVMDFNLPDGYSADVRNQDAGKIISDQFVMTLPAARFHTISRRYLQEVLTEQKFQMSGLTEGNILKVGRLVGARSILVGHVIKYKKLSNLFGDIAGEVSFSFQLLDVETGNILFSGSAQFDEPWENVGPEIVSGALVQATVQRMADQ